ncbi:hypothetical protein JCM10450v2_007234 [Rhodotorula kratochvilovae]
MQPPLPVELIERILGERALSQADLARCCLASSGMLSVAQPLLYTTFELCVVHDRWPTETWAWATTLRAKPELAELVRSVRVSMYAQIIEDQIDGVDAPDTDACDIAWEALALCPRLEHLQSLEWPASPLQAPFFHSLRTLGLLPLDEETYEVLLQLPNVKNLSVERGSMPFDLGDDCAVPAFQLEVLRVDFGGPKLQPEVLDAVLRNSRSSLRTVELEVPSEEDEAFIDLALYPNLTTLSVGGYDTAALIALLKSCSALRTLRIDPRHEHLDRQMAFLADEAVNSALPSTLSTIELPGLPTEEQVDAWLRGLAPRVQLRTLGAANRLGGAAPLSITTWRDEDGWDQSEWLASEEECDAAMERWDALAEYCGQRGIALVHSSETVLPAEAWVRV